MIQGLDASGKGHRTMGHPRCFLGVPIFYSFKAWGIFVVRVSEGFRSFGQAWSYFEGRDYKQPQAPNIRSIPTFRFHCRGSTSTSILVEEDEEG